MITPALSKIAKEYDMTIEKGVGYGLVHGCFITLTEGAGFKRISIYAGIPVRKEETDTPSISGAQAVADAVRALTADWKKYRLLTGPRAAQAITVSEDGAVAHICFIDTIGTGKRIRAFMEDALPQLAPLTAPRTCSHCGKETDAATYLVRRSDYAAAPMHSQCVDSLNASLDQLSAEEKPSPVLLPIVGAFVGAMVGAALWAVVGALGYVLSLAGVAVAFLSAKGYTLLGGKPGKKMLAVLLVMVVLAVLAGNAAVLVYELHKVYREAASTLKPWETIVSEGEFLRAVIPEVWQDGETRGELIRNCVLGLFFAGLGSFGILAANARKPEEAARPLLLNGRLP